MPETNTIWPYFRKRKSFEHEREVRIVLQDGKQGNADPFRPNEERGRLIPLELESVVKAIVVAPTAPTWFKDTVEKVAARYGYTFPVNQSSIDDDPVL